MMAKKRTKIITVTLALLSVIVMAFGSSITVFAENNALSDYIDANNQAVVESGILEEESIFEDIKSSTDDTALEVAQKVVELVALRAQVISDYSDDNIAEMAEPKSVKDVKQIRDTAIAYRISSEILLSGALDYLSNFENQFKQKIEEIPVLLEEDYQAWCAKVTQKIEEILEEYNKLASKNNLGEGNEYSKVGYYSSTQFAALKAVLDSYVHVSESGAILSENNEPIEYVAKDVLDCTAKLEALTQKVIVELKAVPKNDIEIAIKKYNDYLNLQEGYASNSELESAITELKGLARKAKNFYENSRTSEEVKKEYSNEYAVLTDFLDYIDTDGGYVPVRVSTLRDQYNVIKITAKYASGSKKGQKADVIPDNCELFLYSSTNSAPKRNVTNQLKAMEDLNKKLSVAYYLTLRVIRGGYDRFTLPEKDGYVNIEYEVQLDLAAYYSYYCEGKGIEKDKLQNIIDASQLIKDIANSSICYGYNNGIVQALNFTLDSEGGIVMFTTTSSNLTHLCVAGSGLDSIFTQLWFWVVAVIALILLIIIIRAIVKHVRYTIKFVTNGGSVVPNVRAAKGEYFVMPADPIKPGYVFAGWFTNKALTNRFVGTCMRKRKGFKLYAKWVSPLTQERIIEMYDALRDSMRSYKKVSFKPLLGLSENELIAAMYFKENHIQLNLALNLNDLKREGISVLVSKEKKFAEVPAQILISTEELFATALDLVKRALIAKGLQQVDDYEPGAPSTAEERKNGFAYMINNDRVASTAEDYFEMLRIALKGYVMEEDNGMFKPGDKVTLARIYITNEVACLHLPTIKGEKGLKPSRDARFEDTPVIVKILAPRDMLDAYNLIDKVMKANGFVKNPEAANELTDVKVPATNGFAYTLVF